MRRELTPGTPGPATHLVLTPAPLVASLPDFTGEDEGDTGQGLIEVAAVSEKAGVRVLVALHPETAVLPGGISALGKFCKQTSRKHQWET